MSRLELWQSIRSNIVARLDEDATKEQTPERVRIMNDDLARLKSADEFIAWHSR